MNDVWTQILMLAYMKQQCGNPASQNPKTETIISSLTAVAGRDEKASKDELERQLSIFDTQLSTMQIFSCIPQFAPYFSQMAAKINEQKAALELVYDHFEGFAGVDGFIDKSDLAKIEEAAEYDGNKLDFSETDLADIYYLNGGEYNPTEEFSLSKFNFSAANTIKNEHGNQEREFDDDYSNKNILIKDDRDDDTYIVTEDIEESNLVFTNLDDGDKLNLEGTWSAEQIYDEETDEEYVLYTNEENGTNVFVKGTLDDVEDLVNVDEIITDDEPGEWAAPNKTQQDKLLNNLYKNILGRDAEQSGFEAWKNATDSANDVYGINLADGITQKEKIAMIKTFIAGSINEINKKGLSTEQLTCGICDTLGIERAGMYMPARASGETDEDYLKRINKFIDDAAKFVK